MGPTWDRNPFYTGPRDPQGYILPELTLGWQILRWVEDNLLADEVPHVHNGVRWGSHLLGGDEKASR